MLLLLQVTISIRSFLCESFLRITISLSFPVFNTNCTSMDTCAAGMFCQRFHDGADLDNGTCMIEAECELCLQWFHSECVSFIPLEVKNRDLYCGCHIDDIWEDAMWVISSLSFWVTLSSLLNGCLWPFNQNLQCLFKRSVTHAKKGKTF